MKIVIDARPAELSGFGIARYVHELIAGLARSDQHNQYVLLANTRRLEAVIKDNPNFTLRTVRAKWLSPLEQLELPLVLRLVKPDLFHATTFAAPLFCPCPLAVSILDLIHLDFPRDYSFLHRLYYRIIGPVLGRARAVITISEYSKKRIGEYFGLAAGKIKVTYISASAAFRELEKPEPLVAAPYIMTVGNPKPHKNTLNLLKAYAGLKARGLEHKLVIVGGINEEAREAIERGGLAGEVVLLSGLDDEEMARLYNLAAVFVFPSRYEGFGLPVLEAMACGAPVVTTNVTSLPEVAGDAALLVDPENVERMAEAIGKLAGDENLRQELRRKGLERARQFSWRKCAEETRRIYEQTVIR